MAQTTDKLCAKCGLPLEWFDTPAGGDPAKTCQCVVGRSALADGIYPAMPEAEYRALKLPNATALKVLAQGGTPAHLRAAIDDGGTDTEAQGFGRLVHRALLEPESSANILPLPPEIKRRAGKEYDALLVGNPGIIYLPPSEWKTHAADVREAEKVSAAAHAHPILHELLSASAKEVTLLWTDTTTGLQCKARLDMLTADHLVVADIKTTSKIIPYQIARAAYYFGYHVQFALYTDAVKTLFNTDPKFYAVFVEVTPPHLVLVCDGHAAYDERDQSTRQDSYYELGRSAYLSALVTYRDCLKTGDWYGHGFDVLEMAIPKNAGMEGL